MKKVRGLVRRSRGRLYHIEAGGATYFLTFAAGPGESFSRREREIIIASCKHGHPDQWMLDGAVVMPDHVHMLLTPVAVRSESGYAGEGTRAPYWISLSEIVKGIKSVTARKINRLRGRERGSIWLDEYYDRIVRDEEDFMVKIKYMKSNPVKKGLVTESEDWDALWISEKAQIQCGRLFNKKR